MKKNNELLAYYSESVHFSQVSGFEILEMLDVRSRLALAYRCAVFLCAGCGA